MNSFSTPTCSGCKRLIQRPAFAQNAFLGFGTALQSTRRACRSQRARSVTVRAERGPRCLQPGLFYLQNLSLHALHACSLVVVVDLQGIVGVESHIMANWIARNHVVY